MVVLKLPEIPIEVKIFFLVLKLIPCGIFDVIKAFISWLIPRRFKKLKDISGYTILITGAGSGLGRQLAIEFSKFSVNLVLLDLYSGPLNDTISMLNPSSKAILYECDVTNREKVYETAADIKTKVGKVDILVNNAGVVGGKRFLDLPDDKIRLTMEVNTMSHFWMLKAFLPEMMDTNKGHIVGIASMAGFAGFPRLVEYCTSKYGAIGLMEALRWELDSEGKDGVKVTAVCPNLMTTGLFEGSKPALTMTMTPEYVAKEVIQGVLEEKPLMLIPGFLHFLVLFRWLLPFATIARFYRNSGLLTFMDEFKGRIEVIQTNGIHP